MMQAVKGIYRDGKVELLESPSGITEGEVIVTFVQSSKAGTLPEQNSSIEETRPDSDRANRIYLGMFSGSGQGTTEEDFKLAEFHGDPDDGLDWS